MWKEGEGGGEGKEWGVERKRRGRRREKVGEGKGRRDEQYYIDGPILCKSLQK